MRTFTWKGWGRIYVDKPENVKFVINKIKELDDFEYDYLPDGFVAPFSEYPKLVYTHKFDTLDCDKLTAECWKEGVYIFCLDNGCNEFIDEIIGDVAKILYRTPPNFFNQILSDISDSVNQRISQLIRQEEVEKKRRDELHSIGASEMARPNS